MTTPQDLLRDAYGRVHDLVRAALADLSVEELLWRPDSEANSIGWLIWHLTRVQDDHLAEVGGRRQVWEDWSDRIPLPYPLEDLGYGQDSDQVGAFTVVDPALLAGYHAAVHRMSIDVVDRLTSQDLDRIIDERWDPPVTVAVRLVSVASDTLQHVGQAAYLRGLVLRRR